MAIKRLVLSRRAGQRIVIGGLVQVKVDLIRGNRVSLAIEAPEEVTIDREEVHTSRTERLRRQAEQAAGMTAGETPAAEKVA